jgi:hypothetical protein
VNASISEERIMSRFVRFGFVLVAFAAFLAAGCAGHHDVAHHGKDAVSDGTAALANRELLLRGLPWRRGFRPDKVP